MTCKGPSAVSLSKPNPWYAPDAGTFGNLGAACRKELQEPQHCIHTPLSCSHSASPLMLSLKCQADSNNPTCSVAWNPSSSSSLLLFLLVLLAFGVFCFVLFNSLFLIFFFWWITHKQKSARVIIRRLSSTRWVSLSSQYLIKESLHCPSSKEPSAPPASCPAKGNYNTDAIAFAYLFVALWMG